jgi:hypothetical protein
MTRTYPKHCERCGRAFECGLSRCWCKDVPVSDAQYDRIVKRYHDCLCPTCLAELTGNTSGPSIPESLG